MPARPPRRCAAPAGSEFSPRHDLQRFVIQHRLGQHILELGVLRFQRLEPLGVGHIQAAELAAPQVEGGIAETVLAAQLLDRGASGRPLQEANDLLVGETLLYVRPRSWDGLYLSQAGPGNRGQVTPDGAAQEAQINR